MRGRSLNLGREVSTLFNLGVIRDLGDGQLLERFANSQGEAAELAFAAILERHGPMVLRVCRAQLPDLNDAHDAFQATFLVLIERSAHLWVQDSLGPWLHQVAWRTARRVRASAAHRRRLEQTAAAGTARFSSETACEESERVLHQEIDRLPDRYRIPIVLCDLEGRTVDEVARRLGRPVGTVKCWRSRGREKLRRRLIRAGITPAIGLAFSARSRGEWESAVAASQSAAQAFLNVLSSGILPKSLQVLVKGVSRNMFWHKLATSGLTGLMALIAGVAAVAGLVASGGQQGADSEKRSTERAPATRALPNAKSDAVESWRLALPEAIRIGLQNHADRFRFLPAAAGNPKKTDVKPIGTTPNAPGVKDEPYLVITNAQSVVNPQQFRAEVMALVRSIANSYWDLSLQQSRLRAAEEASELVGNIAAREKAELAAGKSTVADVAEAVQRLEQCQLDVVTRTSDVVTAERQLRTILALPLTGSSRIEPATDPIEKRVEYDWNECLASMRENLLWPGATLDERLSKVAIHALARAFLEIDANYKRLGSAALLRNAAAMRLETQRSFYEERRITIDRYMDANTQFSQALAQEAQSKVAYNVSMVMLEEAKGTLLQHYHIDLIELPTPPRKTELPGAMAVSTLPQLPPMAEAPAAPMPPPVRETEAESSPVATPSPVRGLTIDGEPSDSDRKAITFHLTIPLGPKPIEIRGSLTIAPISHDSTQK